METVMNGIGKHAGFYRGYQPHDRSLVPLTIVLATTFAALLLFYLVGAVGPAPKGRLEASRPAITAISSPPSAGGPALH